MILNNIRHRLREYKVEGFNFIYAGKDFYDIFPEERPKPGTQDKRSSEGPVVVSASHGLYHHKKYGWVFQRPITNGIQEDRLTPGYAKELRELISTRSNLLTATARPLRDGKHDDSGNPWNDMSAREHLKSLYPDSGGTLWATMEDRRPDDVEYHDDIRSRPFYSNLIGARASINIHTDASASESDRGTNVYVAKDSDKPMADSILCYMGEKIHAQVEYKDFYVARAATIKNHGENRLADAPSVIVETAFHTSPKDAEALQDPIFRTAAMKGIEKGYRLFAEGKSCQPFNLERIDNKSLGTGQTVTVEAEYKGYPDLPLKLEVKVRDCPKGWKCTGGTRLIRELSSSPLRFDVSCRAPESGSVDFETTLTDVDGVTSDRVQHYVNCSVPYDERDPTVHGVMEMVPEGDFPSPPEPATET
jgi:hypothetical protein